MNLTHLHLLINHLPIIGSILGVLVLIHGLYHKSGTTISAAYNLLILSAIGAVIAYFTGEPAEETVENIPGIAKALIEEHEEAALFALISFIALGVLSLAGLYLNFKNSNMARAISRITLALGLVSFIIIARTGYLGGLIRHTELNTAVSSQNIGQSEADDD